MGIKITNEIQCQLLDMYDQMQEQFLHTILIPAPEPMHSGHMIRVADNQNPDWYRELCASYPSNCKSQRNRFKPGTKIKRQAVLNFLLNPYKHNNFKYGPDLVRIAEQQLEQFRKIDAGDYDDIPF